MITTSYLDSKRYLAYKDKVDQRLRIQLYNHILLTSQIQILLSDKNVKPPINLEQKFQNLSA